MDNPEEPLGHSTVQKFSANDLSLFGQMGTQAGLALFLVHSRPFAEL
jgi:hypothetical protein